MDHPLRQSSFAGLLLGLLPLVAEPLTAQMELRREGLYDREEFASTRPRLGEPTPELRLCDLHGRPRSLALERGRTVVLIGAAYT